MTKTQEIQLKFSLKQHQTSSYGIFLTFSTGENVLQVQLMQRKTVFSCVGYEAFLINSICSVRSAAQCAITTNMLSLNTPSNSSDTSLSFEKLQTVPEPHTERLEKLRDMSAVILHEMNAGDPSQILSSCAHVTSFTRMTFFTPWNSERDILQNVDPAFPLHNQNKW